VLGGVVADLLRRHVVGEVRIPSDGSARSAALMAGDRPQKQLRSLGLYR
jgi:hypothetical protein